MNETQTQYHIHNWNIYLYQYFSLRGKCSKSKFPYLARIQENTDQKKLRIWTFFTQCLVNLKALKTIFYSKISV